MNVIFKLWLGSMSPSKGSLIEYRSHTFYSTALQAPKLLFDSPGSPETASVCNKKQHLSVFAKNLLIHQFNIRITSVSLDRGNEVPGEKFPERFVYVVPRGVEE